MIEIKYGEHFEVVDVAGNTIHEARDKFKAEFEIPDKARAKLNGKTIKSSLEPKIVLNDDDSLSFAVVRSRVPYLVGAILLALAITGGVFAFGFINAATTLTAVTYNSNFADVSVNTTGLGTISWNAWGYYKGSIDATVYDTTYLVNSFNGTPIFNIDTWDSHYPGDLVVTVSLGNADQLVKRYRALSLQLCMLNSQNQTMDINQENGSDNATDWVMLTLDNGAVSMFPSGTPNGDNMTVRIKKGFYITQVFPGTWQGDASPELFCEVAQR